MVKDKLHGASEAGFGTGASMSESLKCVKKAALAESDKWSPLASYEMSRDRNNAETANDDTPKSDPKKSTLEKSVDRSEAMARVNPLHHTILFATTKSSLE